MDSSRLHELDWKPRVSWQEGMDQTSQSSRSSSVVMCRDIKIDGFGLVAGMVCWYIAYWHRIWLGYSSCLKIVLAIVEIEIPFTCVLFYMIINCVCITSHWRLLELVPCRQALLPVCAAEWYVWFVSYNLPAYVFRQPMYYISEWRLNCKYCRAASP